LLVKEKQQVPDYVPLQDERPSEQQSRHGDDEVAMLDGDDVADEDSAEDSIDGMAAITDPEQVRSQFFGRTLRCLVDDCILQSQAPRQIFVS
jgi:hypothetical protein